MAPSIDRAPSAPFERRIEKADGRVVAQRSGIRSLGGSGVGGCDLEAVELGVDGGDEFVEGEVDRVGQDSDSNSIRLTLSIRINLADQANGSGPRARRPSMWALE